MSDPQAVQNHPDAGLLAAFAERGLTPPERAALAVHLAVCARCRDVVFLAQQAIPEQQAAAAQPASRPRIRLWQPLAAAGFAAILLSVVSLTWFIHLRDTRGKAEISLVRRAPVLAPAGAPTPPPTAAASHTAAAPAPAAPQHSGTAHRPPEPAAVPGRIELGMAKLPAVGPSALPGQSAPAFASAAPPAEPSPAAAPLRPIPSEQIGLQRQMVARQQAATQPTSQRLTLSTVEPSTRSAPGQTAMRAAGIPPPLAAAASATVFRGAPAPGPHGGFTPASRLKIQGRILTLDPSGALFASDDTDQHWRALQSPCAGPAISLAILPITAPRAVAGSGAAAASPAASAPVTTAASKPAPKPSPVIVSLVCASGSRWTSQDRGDTWQPAAGEPAAPRAP